MALQAEEILVEHGGSLERAAALFPDAPRPFVDLSTGINPCSYPLFDLPATAFTRLPEPGRLQLLLDRAAEYYGAASTDGMVAAAGTQALTSRIARFVAPGRAAILSPTYAEHALVARAAGHDVVETSSLQELTPADLAIIVNPNNPDGRLTPRGRLLEIAVDLRKRDGILVVDEAFMDADASAQSCVGDVPKNLIVLRSFGKFFGLAGVRLSFAIADKETAKALRSDIGPWPVSGPALEYGIRALSDRAWQMAARALLAERSARLDCLLSDHGIAIEGGTPLFRFVRTPSAISIFETLGRHGIFVRRFEDRPHDLRIGLPGPEDDWSRLDSALGARSIKNLRKSA